MFDYFEHQPFIDCKWAERVGSAHPRAGTIETILVAEKINLFGKEVFSGEGFTIKGLFDTGYLSWRPHVQGELFPLTRHRVDYWRTLEFLGGGGLITPSPLLSREPLVVESRARQHSKALHMTRTKLLSELKIEVTCEVKVGPKVKLRRFDVLVPGDQDYRTWWLKLRQNNFIGMVKVWYEYKWHTKKTSRSRSGHKRSLIVRM